jgi:hypothetical protein
MKLITLLISIFMGLSFSLGWAISHPKIITVPYEVPYEVQKPEPYFVIEYIDRWHEPQIVTINVTEIREVEVVKETVSIVYQNRLPQDWESIEQFIDWYYSQGFTLLFPSGAYTVDCDDYAEWVNREALKQSYHISDALTWNGMYYNKRVTNNYTSQIPGHVGNLVLIQGAYYYFEPMIKDFNGLIKVAPRD